MSDTFKQPKISAMTGQVEVLKIQVDDVTVEGELAIPTDPRGLIIFSHGSGSSRFSPRNNYVAFQLQRKGFATFLLDLLTQDEDEVYTNRFNIELLGHRLKEVTKTLQKLPLLKSLPAGYFGASTGAASALLAASELKGKISAVVSRGGRPDLADDSLYLVECPTLLIVGKLDVEVINLNRIAEEKLTCTKKLVLVDGATHLFEEPGTLEKVAELSADWFSLYLMNKEQGEHLSHTIT